MVRLGALPYLCRIKMHFAVSNYRDVFSVFQELHDFGAFSGHLCPAGLCGGILLQSTQLSSGELKINLFEFLARRGADAKGVVFDSYELEVVDEGLAPDAQKSFLEGGHGCHC